MANRLTQRKKKGLLILLALYILAALASGPVSRYSIILLCKDVLYNASRGQLWVYPVVAFPWLLFLAAGLFIYIKEDGWKEKALFVILLCYVTLFNLPHPWIIEFMLLTPK